MVVSIFNKSMKKSQASKLETSTLRGFGGGWNAVDDDHAMAPRYCTSLVNFQRTPSGGQQKRWGTKWFVDIKDVNDSPIVDQYYFNGRLINVCENGVIVSVTDGGTKAVIWNTAIAAELPGAPSAWTTGVTQVSFVPFKNTLIIHNGQDKPVSISSAFAVTYLQDLATGSNVNVPIGKYGCIAANYHCVAGFSASPTEIIISAAGTSGTFVGDPDPNDSISIDVGAYAPEGAAAIRGIAGFRTNLIVFLQGIAIQVILGIYDGTTHKPEFPDTFPKFGLIGNRCITVVENDLVFAGLGGLTSARRNAFVTQHLDSSYLSNIIEPEYRERVAALSDTEQLVNSFSIYDPLQRNYILFTKDGNALCYTSNEKLNYKGWSSFVGMDYTCGCTSFLGRVFLSKGTRIYQLGNKTFGEEYYADKIYDRDVTWSQSLAVTTGDLVYDSVTDEVYTVSVTHTTPATGTFEDERTATPEKYALYEGVAVDFVLEMPWFEGKDHMKIKHNRFISVGSTGTSEFTVECYVDDLYKDADGNVIYDPALSLTFTGNDTPGFGIFTDQFGGSRRSATPLLYKYPIKFKIIKFRVYGSSVHALIINSFSFVFARGRYFR
jgi:hypothetical protein